VKFFGTLKNVFKNEMEEEYIS